MTHDPTNAARAAWAEEALSAFTARTFRGRQPDSMHRDDLECAIYDLVADLLHYARQQGFDTSIILSQASYHFECELEEEVQP